MRDFVKQISQTLSYLSERTDRKHYTKLFPEGVVLPDEFKFREKLHRSRYLRRRIKMWILKMLSGYRRLKVEEVWEEFAKQDFKAFKRLFKLLFPEPIDLRRVYEALTLWSQTQYPHELMWISDYIIKHKDEVLKYDQIYYDYELVESRRVSLEEAKLILDRAKRLDVPVENFRKEPDGTYTMSIPKKLQFYHISILLHTYIFHVLHVAIFGDSWEKRQERLEWRCQVLERLRYRMRYEFWIELIILWHKTGKRIDPKKIKWIVISPKWGILVVPSYCLLL